MSGTFPEQTDMKMLPGGGSTAAAAAATTVRATASSSAIRQMADMPREELDHLADEYGLDPTRFKTRQEVVAGIHARRQLIAALDREALLDIVRWGHRPVPADASNELLAQEIARVRSMKFGGLSQRGLVALSRLRGVETGDQDPVPGVIKKLRRQEGVFAKLNRKRREMLGSIVSKMVGEEGPTDYQFLPDENGNDPAPAAGASAVAGAQGDSRTQTIKDEIADAGLFGGIANRVKRTADSYINQKLDEIEARIDRKLDEIDRRLGEWRDKEIANRIRILKITLWASVIVAAVSLLYSYVQVNFYPKPEPQQPIRQMPQPPASPTSQPIATPTPSAPATKPA